MTAKRLYIGIDSGTQGTKGVVLDDRGSILTQAYAGHDLIEDENGLREQKPEWWIAACDKVLQELCSCGKFKPSDVAGIGVSGQQHGMVPLDAEGEVIRPAKLWCDTATAAQCKTITERLGGNRTAVAKTGNSIAAGFTASKVLWLREKEPRNYERLATILLPHDYINFWLSGERATDFGDASGTAYFDVSSRQWSGEALKAIDSSGKLEQCLPRLTRADEPVGTVRREIADKYGFKSDTTVSSGGGDNMMAAIGTGNVRPGVITASLGTSGTIYAHSDYPIIDPDGELAAFCSSTGGWLPLICTMNVTVATELTRKLFGFDTTMMNEQALSAPAGSQGVMLLPYFNGERIPNLPEAKASLHGLGSTNYTPANVCRASMEGATMGLRYGLDVLRAQGVSAEEVRLVGGGSKSPLWRKIVADVFGCRVVRPESAEAGAVGAAIQAMWCRINSEREKIEISQLTDRFISLAPEVDEPDPNRVKLYEEMYEKYLETSRRLWSEMNE